VHTYSDRDAAPASRYPEKVPELVARARAKALKRLEVGNLVRAHRWLPLRP
jgi:tRNA A37 methylthiotransferase MiaB